MDYDQEDEAVLFLTVHRWAGACEKGRHGVKDVIGLITKLKNEKKAAIYKFLKIRLSKALKL